VKLPLTCAVILGLLGMAFAAVAYWQTHSHVCFLIGSVSLAIVYLFTLELWKD
jgi:hypothetical protein